MSNCRPVSMSAGTAYVSSGNQPTSTPVPDMLVALLCACSVA